MFRGWTQWISTQPKVERYSFLRTISWTTWKAVILWLVREVINLLHHCVSNVIILASSFQYRVFDISLYSILQEFTGYQHHAKWKIMCTSLCKTSSGKKCSWNGCKQAKTKEAEGSAKIRFSHHDIGGHFPRLFIGLSWKLFHLLGF